MRAASAWTVDRLKGLVASMDARLRLVPPRTLRRIARSRFARWSTGLFVPHADGLVVSREEAVAAGVGSAVADTCPETLLLIAEPPQGWLAHAGDPEVLLLAWRQVMHLMAHEALSGLNDAACEARARALGGAEFDEIRSVLEADRRVPRGAGCAETYREFAATYTELRWLAEAELADTFPGLGELEAVDRVVFSDLDGVALLEQARPPGAEVPVVAKPSHTHKATDVCEDPDEPAVAERPSARADRRVKRLVRRSERAEIRGNDVRAAILRTRAAGLTTPARAGELRASAHDAMGALCGRLERALELESSTLAEWRDVLCALNEKAWRGFPTSAARVLYDLQRVCLDHERPLYELNVVEWALSFGHRAIKSTLPNQTSVRTVRHLRRAFHRLGRVPLGEFDRARCERLLLDAVGRAESRLRAELEPLVERALERSDLRAANTPEEVSRRAIVSEMLDLVVKRGYLTIGDLRDSIARNDLKLPDLQPRMFVRGDALLQADRRMGVALRGIYRRAESYLRVLQKASSLAFGTAIGRALTLFVVIPFGGAYAALETAQHTVETAQSFLTSPSAIEVEAARVSAATMGAAVASDSSALEHVIKKAWLHEHAPHWTTLPLVLGLGALIFGLMHWAEFRAMTMRCARGLAWGARALFWDIPIWFGGLPLVRALLASRALWWFAQWVFGPLAAAACAVIVARLLGGAGWPVAFSGVAGYGVGVLLLNTAAGRLVLETVVDSASRVWDRVCADLLPGLFQAIMGFFHAIIERLDIFLYTVDEWLRFRAGESRWTLGLKAVFGMVWAAISYVARLFVNLLAEPQINPIKHFPTVTVAHKMTAPFLLFVLPAVLQGAPFGMSAVNANLVAFFAQMLLPGVFGFLVWELKENWRLYAANRPKALVPSVVGSHGETVRRLLRPGFHSGTLPRAFARLRRADHATRQRVRDAGRHKQREAIHHVEAGVKAFTERQLCVLADTSQALSGLRLRVGGVECGTNRIAIDVARADDPGEALRIQFLEQGGWLAGSIEQVPGWVGELSEPRGIWLSNALWGYFMRAGVDLAHEQVRAELAPVAAEFEVSSEGLRAWPPDQRQAAVMFDLRDGDTISEAREALGVPAIPGSPGLTVERLLLSQNKVTWARWVEAWERDRAGEAPPKLAPCDLFRARRQPVGGVET